MSTKFYAALLLCLLSWHSFADEANTSGIKKKQCTVEFANNSWGLSYDSCPNNKGFEILTQAITAIKQREKRSDFLVVLSSFENERIREQLARMGVIPAFDEDKDLSPQTNKWFVKKLKELSPFSEQLDKLRKEDICIESIIVELAFSRKTIKGYIPEGFGMLYLRVTPCLGKTNDS